MHFSLHTFSQLLLLALFSAGASADWLRREASIMGTEISVELYHDDESIALEAAEAVLTEMRRIDASMSPLIPSSELARLNENAGKHLFQVSDELYSLLNRSIEFSNLTDGAFDVTFSSAGYLYDYRNRKRPEKTSLDPLLPLIDYHHLILNRDTKSIRFARAGVRIDLGGVAKGYAVDRCIQLLQQRGISHALVAAGGDSRVIGTRWGKPWTIGVRDPRDREKLVAVIPLENVAVSTSGDYERYFEEGGVRYHHILDPKTGDSARELQSVTIIGPDALTTDALSTGLFVLGLNDGLRLANRLPDIEAIIVDQTGTLHYSDGLLSVNKPTKILRSLTEAGNI